MQGFSLPVTGSAGPLPALSGGRALGSGVEFPDLPGGSGQVRVIQPRRHIVLFSLCEEPAKEQRLFEAFEGDIERLLPFLPPKRYLPAAKGRTDVIVTAGAKRVEAELLFAFARDRDHDRLA